VQGSAVVARSESPALSLTDWVVLGLLTEGPRHGFALARELDVGAELGRLWTVRRPLVYRAIDHLLEMGLAKARLVEPGDQGPQRTVVAATRAGHARVRRWLDEPVAHPRDVRSELLVKLALRVRRGDPLAPLAAKQLEVFEVVHDGLRRRRYDGHGVEHLELQWRYEANEAIRRFLQELIRDEGRNARRYELRGAS
jgi:DNA-binding PadR family transcriptional regulator